MTGKLQEDKNQEPRVKNQEITVHFNQTRNLKRCTSSLGTVHIIRRKRFLRVRNDSFSIFLALDSCFLALDLLLPASILKTLIPIQSLRSVGFVLLLLKFLTLRLMRRR
jgi:hypothetical protein